jgi:ketosteroid isomerase-like protein
MKRMGDLHAAGASISFAIHDIVGNDEHVVALVDTTITRPDGRSATSRAAQIYHVRGGQLTEVWTFNEDQAAIDTALA